MCLCTHQFLAGGKNLSWWRNLAFNSLRGNLVLHPFPVRIRQVRPIPFKRAQSLFLQHSISFLLLRFSNLWGCTGRGWIFWSNVCWCGLDAVSGGVYALMISFGHSLASFHHLKEGFQVGFALFNDLDIVLPVTTDCLILLRLFKTIFSRNFQNNIDKARFWLNIY